MKKEKKTNPTLLRQKAEELLKEKKISTSFAHPNQLSENDLLKLIHNLEVHQIELELQNEELLLAKAAEKQLTANYIELYDFAPTPYFTLSKEAKIIRLNLSAAQLLDKNRHSLINSSFAFFVAEHEKLVFIEFFDKIMNDYKTSNCELSLSVNTHPPIFVRLNATLNQNRDECLITAVDLSEHHAYIEAQRQKENLHLSRLHLLEFAVKHTLNELLEEMLNLAEILTGSLIGFSHFVEDDQQTLRLQNWSSRTKKEFCRAEAINMEYKIEKAGIWVDCIRQGHAVIHNDYASLTYKKGLPPGHATLIREMVVPVIRNGKIKAIVGVGNKPTDYVNKDVETITLLADLVWDICERKKAEEELLTSNWRMENIIEASFIGTWQWNVQTGETIFNELWAEIIGYTLDELAPISIMTWQALVHPEDLKQSNKLLEQHFAGELPYYDFECRLKHKDGHWVWIRDRGKVISFSSDGKPLIMFGTHSDINQRKQAEKTLIERAKIFAMFMDNSPIYSFIKEVKPDESRVLRASKNFKEMIGIAGEEMEDKTMHELFPPELATKITADDWSVVTGGEVFKIDEEMNGRKYSTIKFPIHLEDKTLLAGHSIDVTDRLKAEASVRQSKEQYDKLVENIPLGVGVVVTKADASFKFEFLSPRIAEILNQSIESLYADANAITKNMHPDDKNNFAKSFRESIQQKCNFEWQGRFLIEGKTKWLFIFAIPELQPENDEILWNGILTDITETILSDIEIKETNAKLQKVNIEKDKFFSIIAHDLRGPLSNFMGLTKIMAESLSSLSFEEIEKFANSMKNSASNLYRLLENLLEWAKIQQGLIPFNPKLNPLWVIVDESVEMILEAAEKKEIKIAYNFSSEIEVFADSNSLHTIFRNLISNAIKFTHRGGNIEISAQPNSDHNLEISVKDTGIGMSQEMIINLFLIDMETNRKGTESEPSTGLGVFICKDFIEKHGGKLWVESEVGVGTTFYFTLPISY
ncbi:MAG: PAS domain-containing protein [Bacteroidota bacterium]